MKLSKTIFPIDQSVVDQCKNGDPRGAWRGLALAVDFNGNIDWYRMDSWGSQCGRHTQNMSRNVSRKARPLRNVMKLVHRRMNGFHTIHLIQQHWYLSRMKDLH